MSRPPKSPKLVKDLSERQSFEVSRVGFKFLEWKIQRPFFFSEQGRKI